MPKKIQKNNWEYLNLGNTKIPATIRNSNDPQALQDFMQQNQGQLSPQEVAYLQHRMASVGKLSQKVQAVQKSLTDGTYQSRATEVEVKGEGDQASYQLKDLHLPSYQTATYGCWSCFYQLALQSRGIMDLTQEDIRAYRPPMPQEGFSQDADRDMNTDSAQNMVDMGDLTHQLLPNTMIRSTEIWPYRQAFGREPREEDREAYFQKVLEIAKKQITEAIRDHHSPVGVMMDGHYITIVGIEGDKVSYKDSAPGAKNDNSSDQTITEDLATVLGPAMNGVNAGVMTLNWLEDMVLSKEGNILYRTSQPNTRIHDDGEVTVDAKEEQLVFNLDDRHQTGLVIARSGDVDLGDGDSQLRTNYQVTEGAFCVHKTYLPKKVNVELLKSAANSRSDEAEQAYQKERQEALDKQKAVEELLPEIREEMKNLEPAAVAAVNAPEKFKIPIDYVGRPFFGGGNFVDFRSLMGGVGWDKNEHDLLLTAIANVYDVYDVEEGTDQKKAMDQVFSKLTQINLKEARVSAVYRSLSQFVKEIKNGSAQYFDEFGNPMWLSGTNEKNPEELTEGQRKALQYLDSYLMVLSDMAQRAPNLKFSEMNPDQFIDIEGKVKLQELKDNPVLKNLRSASVRANRDRGIWNDNERQNTRRQQAGVPGRGFLAEVMPDDLYMRTYTGAHCKELPLAFYTNDIMYDGFVMDLQSKQLPYFANREEQNMARAVFNLVSSAGNQYGESYNHFLNQHQILNESDFTDLLLHFHEMQAVDDRLAVNLYESAKCIHDVLSLKEERLFLSLQNAYNSANPARFAEELLKWEKTEQLYIEKRGEPVHFSDRVKDALPMIKYEMKTVEQGDPKFNFYKAVKDELMKTPEGQVYLAMLADQQKRPATFFPHRGYPWIEERKVLSELSHKKQAVCTRIGERVLNPDDPREQEDAASLIVCGILGSQSAKKTFFGHTTRPQDADRQDKIRVTAMGMLSTVDVQKNTQAMLEQVLSQKELLKNAMRRATSPKNIYTCYMEEVQRHLSKDVAGAKRAEEREKSHGRAVGEEEMIRLDRKDLNFLEKSATALKNLYAYNGKFRSGYMEKLYNQLGRVIRTAKVSNGQVGKSELVSLRNKSLVYFDKRKGILMGPITDKGKARLEIVEHLGVRLGKMVKPPAKGLQM
ncbi:MAG: hypothetical protein K6E18_01055 [Lachnospiraceae bacterium]|nr:hypothetical protein [Lachnospiraceae bacterium]